MAKLKLTKGELKRQRDSLRQFQRYLPTLQLKKQQLQIEILHQKAYLEQKELEEQTKRKAMIVWAGLLSEKKDLRYLLKIQKIEVTYKNIAGVSVPEFKQIIFEDVEYDLFLEPLWLDKALEQIKELVSLEKEITIIKEGIGLLEEELRITTQRVNLFEKIKIPEAQEAIRKIKVYLGDQMANAVGRSKIAKKKIEAIVWQEAII
ncbi:MAG: V-type ATP synthase subunit D [Candidatus Omnitrophica bacterium]|nr:V-type ATP synthase subunit D [Candidatus Omnitrophota bacterium]